MLFHKLQGAGGLGGKIEYVGGYTLGFTGSTSNRTITWGGSLTGGLDTVASKDDLVVAWVTASTAGTINFMPTVSGYTKLIQTAAVDNETTSFSVNYKFMGDTPDSTTVLTGGTGSNNYAGAVVIQVFRNVDQSVPVTLIESNIESNTVLADPPSITPVVSGSWILAGGAGSHLNGARTFSSSDLTNFLSAGGNDTEDATIGAGYKVWESGAFNPSQFTFSGTDATSNSNSAFSLVINPKPPTGNSVQFISQTVLGEIGTISATTEVDDLVLFAEYRGSGTPPGLQSGWTNIITGSSGTARSVRVSYKIATDTTTSASTLYGTGGILVVLRNATQIGQSSVTSSSATGSDFIQVPSISGLTADGLGVLVGGGPSAEDNAGLYQIVKSPFAVTNTNTFYSPNNAIASYAGGYININLISGSVPVLGWLVEVLP